MGLTYFCTMESTRQQKLARLIQKDLGDIFQREGASFSGTSMVTVTKVHVTRDLSIAKAYLSLFATNDKQQLLKDIQRHTGEIRYKLGKRIGKQVRAVPEIQFYLDDSLDYIENIEKLLGDE
jgi:ribosome-binding factor A